MITYDINGVSTNIETAYHCKVFRVDSDTAPARDVEYIEIPGRSGDIIIDNGRYPNVEMMYTAVFYESNGNGSADTNAQNLKNALLAQRGYQKLTDSEHPGEFYLATISENIEPRITRERNMVKVEITFNRKPQRFLDSGTTQTTYTSNSFSITNPTLFPSKPKIEAVIANSGTYGQIVIGDKTIRVNAVNTTVVIDSEMQDCYYGATNKNSLVVFSDNNFPVLKSGANAITKTSNVTLKITPNWWRL